MLAVFGSCEIRRYVTHGLHERASRLRHLFDFHVVEQATLFLALGSALLTAIELHTSGCARVTLHLDLALGNLIEYVLEELARQVLVLVDATIHVDVVLFGHFLFHLSAMQIGRQHDDAKRQHVHGVGTLEIVVTKLFLSVAVAFFSGRESFLHVARVHVGELFVQLVIACGEFLHESIDLLRLAWQTKALEKETQCAHNLETEKVHLIHVRVHDLFVEFLVLTEKVPYGGLVQASVFQKELSNLVGRSTE